MKMKHFRIFCLLVTSVFVGGSGVAFGHDAACGTLGDEDLILTLPCVVSGDKAYSATLLPIKRPDGNVGKWTLQAGSVKSASFDPGNNNCANYNPGVSLAVRCVLHDGALWSAEFGANYPVFDLRSYAKAVDNVGNSLATVPAGSILRVAYVDAFSPTFADIPDAGFAAPDILIYAFVYSGLTSKVLDPLLIKAIKSAAPKQSAGSKTFISIGGQNGPSAITNTATVVSNVSAGIKALNDTLPKANQVVGVDLDLENSISAATISALAAGFKQAGFLVSIAPQLFATGWPIVVNPSDPSNLYLTSGETLNQYGAALASGKVDYIFVQAYNNGPGAIKIGGCDETQTCLVGQLATALNSLTKDSCAGSTGTPLCIPSTTRYAIGLPSIRGAAGEYSIWQPYSVAVSYEDQNILSALAVEINKAPLNGKNGIMTWVLNADYSPAKDPYNDSYACTGGFSSVVFGATQAMSCPAPP
jgi:chitinase